MRDGCCCKIHARYFAITSAHDPSRPITFERVRAVPSGRLPQWAFNRVARLGAESIVSKRINALLVRRRVSQELQIDDTVSAMPPTPGILLHHDK
jgi:hypothetical protein